MSVIPLATRRWRIRATGQRPLTINEVTKIHRLDWAARTSTTRHLWWGLATEAHIPSLDRIVVTVTPLHRDRRSPQDTGACAPEAKAAIDGLVDAHIIPNDTPNHLLAITFTPPHICGTDGMSILVEEAL